MVGVFFDLVGEEQLGHVKVGVAHAGIIIQLPVIRPARGERSLGGNEFALEQTGQGAGAAVIEIDHGGRMAGGAHTVGGRRHRSRSRGGEGAGDIGQSRTGGHGRGRGGQAAGDADVTGDFLCEPDLRPFAEEAGDGDGIAKVHRRDDGRVRAGFQMDRGTRFHIEALADILFLHVALEGTGQFHGHPAAGSGDGGKDGRRARLQERDRG